MRKKLVLLSVILAFSVLAFANRIVESDNEYSDAKAFAARTSDGSAGIAVQFEGTDGLHYYADKEDAPGNMPLELDMTLPEGCSSKPQRFPGSHPYYDKALEKNINVYSGGFIVFIPFDCDQQETVDISIRIHGLACTDNVCIRFDKTLSIAVNMADIERWPLVEMPVSVRPVAAAVKTESTVTTDGITLNSLKYFLLAILAGLSFNIMPCVWPVLPLAMQRLVNFSGGSKKTLLLHGIAFCAGIVSFFAIFAVVSIILKLTTGAALDWSEHLRYPAVIMTMGLVLIVLALFMFDVFTVGVPASIASKSGGNGTVKGSVAMGLLAAVLSTPCSGAILAAVLVWAQTQTLLMSTIAILLMGVGMMLPYLILANSPALLKKLPRPGDWMDIIRKSMGFLLLLIAVKLLSALPDETLPNVLYFAVILCFAVWMWGGWVNMMTPKKKKTIIRILALLLVIVTGRMLLTSKTSIIEWKDYDRAAIASLTQSNSPILIKFTAKWCTNCHYLDRTVYSDSEVAAALVEKNITPIIADTTSYTDPATADLKDIYSEPGSVPVTVIIMPDGSHHKLRGVFKKDELLKVIEGI